MLDIGPGQEVITSPFTFAATINAILRSGASVRFADICEDFTVDPASVAALIGPATTALMPVHLYGLPADMRALTSLATANRLAIVEDAAQAHGASVDGRRAGSFGVGCFSFYATKNVTSGEGGCVTTDDAMVAERLRVTRNQGMRSRYDYAMIGQNWRMTDVAAAIAIPQMQRLDEINARGVANAAALTSLLADEQAVTTPAVPAGRTHVWHQYTMLLEPGDRPRPCGRLDVVETAWMPACTTRASSGITRRTGTIPTCTVTTRRSRASAPRDASRSRSIPALSTPRPRARGGRAHRGASPPPDRRGGSSARLSNSIAESSSSPWSVGPTSAMRTSSMPDDDLFGDRLHLVGGHLHDRFGALVRGLERQPARQRLP